MCNAKAAQMEAHIRIPLGGPLKNSFTGGGAKKKKSVCQKTAASLHLSPLASSPQLQEDPLERLIHTHQVEGRKRRRSRWRLRTDGGVPPPLPERTCLHESLATGFASRVPWLPSHTGDGQSRVPTSTGVNDQQSTPPGGIIRPHCAARLGSLVNRFPVLRDQCKMKGHPGTKICNVVKTFCTSEGGKAKTSQKKASTARVQGSAK